MAAFTVSVLFLLTGAAGISTEPPTQETYTKESTPLAAAPKPLVLVPAAPVTPPQKTASVPTNIVLAQRPKPKPTWVNPLPGRCNRTQAQGGTGYFGASRDGGTRAHAGVDIVAPMGTPIHASHAGTVSVGWDSGAGNYLVIDHHDGTWTVYMHLSKYEVKSGNVATDQVIGYVGSTGHSTGPHLHFETHTALWKARVNPITFMRDHGVDLSC